MIKVARVTNDFDERAAIGLTNEAKTAIESAEWILTDAEPVFEYENNKVTDSRSGTFVLLLGPRDRKASKLIRNKNLKLKLEDVWSEAECETLTDLMPEVRVKINKSTVWGSSDEGSKYVQMHLTLHASLIDENGEVVTPSKLIAMYDESNDDELPFEN